MVRSQNATFRGDEPGSRGERIRGESFAGCIADGLLSRGWVIGEIDDWRDAGFVIPLVHQNAHIEIVITQYYGDERRWILQIAPARFPGFVRRFFGFAALATSKQIHDVAVDTHEILTAADCTDFHWCWDAFADSIDCACRPMLAAG